MNEWNTNFFGGRGNSEPPGILITQGATMSKLTVTHVLSLENIGAMLGIPDGVTLDEILQTGKRMYKLEVSYPMRPAVPEEIQRREAEQMLQRILFDGLAKRMDETRRMKEAVNVKK
jgi:hypothetical protein